MIFDRGSIVGQDGVLSRLQDALTQARQRADGVVLTGGPGLGKSALLDVLTANAAGFRVLRAEGLPIESHLPFSGMHQLLAPLATELRGQPPRFQEVLRSALALGDPVPFDELALGAAVLDLLATAAETQPLLLVVDDAQWLDAGSLRALSFAFRRLADHAVCLAAAERSDSQQRVADLPARLLRVDLAPLGASDALEVVARNSRRSLSAAARARIVSLASGVPLALVELAQTTTPDGVTAPRSVTALMSRLFGDRVDGLPPAVRTLALVAALTEPTEPEAVLAAAAAIAGVSLDGEDVGRSGVVRVAAGRVDFDHPLLRQSVVEHASAAQIRLAHSALASAFTVRGDAVRALVHRASSISGTDEALAAELEHLAASYRQRGGHPASARILVESARLSPTVAERASRLVSAADAARRGGDTVWATELAVRAQRDASDGTIQARAMMILGHVDARVGSTDSARRRYQRVAEQMSVTDPDMAAVAWTYASSAEAVLGNGRASLGAARRAVEMLTGDVEGDTTLAVRETLGSALALCGDVAQARPLLRQAAQWYLDQDQRAGAEFAAEALIWMGEWELAGRLLDDVAVDARQLASPGLLIQALELRADLLFRTGEWARGLADASEASSLAHDTGQSVLGAYAQAIEAVLLAFGGKFDRARVVSGQAHSSARRHGLTVVAETAAYALGAIELATGHPDLALAHLEPVSAAVAASHRFHPAVCLWPSEFIESLVAARRLSEAEAAIEELAERAERADHQWARGVVARYRGVLANDTEFDDHFAAAVAAHEAVGMPFELARTRLRYGQRLRRSGRRVDARMQLQRAVVAFEALDARPWADRARQELISSGGDQPPSTEDKRRDLTPQELQVARLIADGASNREAATSLFVSQKTIETHLTRVYRKLGVRSRSQLVVVLKATAT